MNKHTVRLNSHAGRMKAAHLIGVAPDGWTMELRAPRRTGEQNDKLWAMLTDISMAKPEGRKLTPEQWKCVFMQACGWEVQFLEGLDGQPFPAGFRSSKMTVKQMSDLIEFIQAKGDEWGVRWTE